jgi:hypothetical protein
MDPIMVWYIDGKFAITAGQQGKDGEHQELRF